MLILQTGLDRAARKEQTMKRIRELCEAGEERIYVLVPEQNTFSMSKLICEEVGNAISNGAVDVIGFKQFIDRVYDNCGGRQAHLDDGGRLLAMALAANATRKELSIFKSSAARPEFLSNLLSTYSMMRLHGITAEALNEASEKLPDSILGSKLGDLGKIFDAYCEICSNGTLDPADDIDTVGKILRDTRWLENTVWFVDGFSILPEQQKGLLRIILEQAKSVTVNVAAESLEDELDSSKLSVRMALELEAIAKELNIKCVEKHSGNTRTIPGALAYLQRNLCDGAAIKNPPKIPNAAKVVRVFCDPTPYQELQHIAGTILKSVRSGYRYRDITVALCDYDKYAPIMDTICRRYGIPAYFSSNKEDIGKKPIMQAINSALDAATRGMQKEDVLQYLKSGMSNLPMADVDRLENYVRTWNIHGRGWAPEGGWVMHPDGYGRELDEDTLDELKEINSCRTRGITPLLKLKSALTDRTTIGGYVEALYDFLDEIDFTAHLQDIVDMMVEDGDSQTAMEYGQVSDVLCHAMEQMYETVGKMEKSPAEFAKMFKLLCSAYKISTIPATLDQIEVSSVEDARFTNSKLRYIAGATEGHFPEYVQGDALLNSSEIEMLNEDMGMTLPGTDDDISKRSMSDIASVIGGASKMLILSYASDPSQPATPSHLVERTMQFFPGVEPVPGVRDDGLYDIDLMSPEAVGRLCGRLINRPRYEYISHALATLENPVVQDIAWKVAHKTFWNMDKVSSEYVRGLYGERIPLTATRADSYASCRYHHFLRYGLKLREPAVGKMTKPIFGTFAHAVIEKTMREVETVYGGFRNIENISQLDAITRKHIDAYTAENMKGLDSQPERFTYMYKRNCRELVSILRNICEEFKVSDFHSTMHEFRIGGEAPNMPAVPIEGKRAQGTYTGIADRIDTCTLADGKTYFRVVDYKTGRTQVMDMSSILAGKSMQLIMYMAAAREHFGKTAESGAEPAAMLYSPAKETLIATPTKVSEEKVASEHEKELKRRGFVVDNPSVIYAMEHIEGPNGKFLPVKMKDGDPVGDEVCSAEQMDSLAEYTQRMMEKMVDDIADGNIAPNPISRGMDRTTCSYCPYKAICHKDACGVKYRYQTQVSRDEFWQAIDHELRKH